MRRDRPLLPQPASYAEYARLRGDPAVWLPGLRVICERHGIDGTSLYAERAGSNVLFRADRGPWIKLFAPAWREEQVVERAGLCAVQGAPGVPAPALLAEGELEGWPYVVIGHREGRPLGEVWSAIDEAARIELAARLGELVGALARVPLKGEPALGEDWPRTLRSLRATCVRRHAEAGAAAPWLDAIGAFVAALPEDFGCERPPVFLHADITDDNVLVAHREGRWAISGLVDYADAMIGHPHYELAAPAVFLLQRRRAAQRAFLGASGVAAEALTPAQARELTAFVLLHRYARLPAILRLCPGRAPASLAELQDALWPLA